MSMTDPLDAARVGLLLGDLRLPAIKSIWADFAERATGRAGPPPDSSPRSPNMRSQSGPGAVSNVTSPKRACRPERPSTPSTSTPCR